ncbi:phosphatidate cytidylyltransferase [Pusillimonas sp. MFBS29]|uniref:phosphatidate cytidylyltransferase n=1 Tax=Pusillimonas sp. MFBS29 TaxID=2886690 RepID=UPI001D0FEA16|nr:phosphatidate cytidylyltransferase [Pusillimonas sp. MFBS29]MCC2595524.1 phosphatidate cytidylyltransferase [Pusillimonas sp. MFBS29]
MLKQRVVTAVILLAVLLASLMASSPWPLVLLFVLTAVCALWEWLRLTWPGAGHVVPPVAAALCGIVLLGLAWQWLNKASPTPSIPAHSIFGGYLLPLVSVLWVGLATALVVQGQATRRSGGVWLSLFGLLAVVAVWFALVQMYLHRGAWFLVSLMALIWFADIAAYFTGKAFGRHKLAPRVSPGKTWEGAAGGVLAATAWVLLSAWWPGSFGDAMLQRWPWWMVALIAVFLAALSIIGDLFESLLKRRAGVKDSSQLLPGHGGVYDRIDALLPVAPIALLITGV